MSPKIKIYKIYMHVRADKHLHISRQVLFCFDMREQPFRETRFKVKLK